MTKRYSKWFTISPLGTSSGTANATYNGVDSEGNQDRITREGVVGETYSVSMYSQSKLEAPNPPFRTGEGFTVSKEESNGVKSKKPAKKARKKATPKKAAKKVAKKATPKKAVKKVAKKAAPKKAVKKAAAKKAAPKKAALKKSTKKATPKKASKKA